MAQILIVEDNPEIRSVLREFLESEGHTVVVAKTGEAGLEAVQEDRPDLILMDIMMPGIDGWELCGKIKSDSRLKDIPVVMVTSKIGKKHMEQSMDCGALAHINKPFKLDQLLETINGFLEQKHA